MVLDEGEIRVSYTRQYHHFFCRIMVLDDGEIREFDTPDGLLQNTEGLFYQLAQDAGIV